MGSTWQLRGCYGVYVALTGRLQCTSRKLPRRPRNYHDIDTFQLGSEKSTYVAFTGRFSVKVWPRHYALQVINLRCSLITPAFSAIFGNLQYSGAFAATSIPADAITSVRDDKSGILSFQYHSETLDPSKQHGFLNVSVCSSGVPAILLGHHNYTELSYWQFVEIHFSCNNDEVVEVSNASVGVRISIKSE